MRWFFRLFQKSAPKGLSKTLFLLECKVHGSHYYESLPLIDDGKLRVGEILQLKREPHNEYDANAIEILTQDNIKIGYVPKKNNLILANLMDQRCQLIAHIDNITTTAWEPISIRIVMAQ